MCMSEYVTIIIISTSFSISSIFYTPWCGIWYCEKRGRIIIIHTLECWGSKTFSFYVVVVLIRLVQLMNSTFRWGNGKLVRRKKILFQYNDRPVLPSKYNNTLLPRNTLVYFDVVSMVPCKRMEEEKVSFPLKLSFCKYIDR